MRSAQDDITLGQILKRIAQRTPMQYKPECNNCMDKGYSVIYLTIKGNKYNLYYHCDEQINQDGSRCLSSRKPLYMAKVKSKQKKDKDDSKYTPFAFEGESESSETRNMVVTFRTLLPSKTKALQIADRFRRLGSQSKKIVRAPLREINSAIDVDSLTTLMSDSSLNESEKLDRMCKMLSDDDDDIDLTF